MVHVDPDFWVLFCSPHMFSRFSKIRVKSAHEHPGERVSIASDQLIDDDFSSSDGAYDISVFTKSLFTFGR